MDALSLKEREVPGTPGTSETTKNVLIIRHLPSSMSTTEKQDFLKYFGAVHVRILSNFGRMVREHHSLLLSFRTIEHLEFRK